LDGWILDSDEKIFLPILGFIHITGGQVEYRATIKKIIPFDPSHYDDPTLKPEPWRLRWQTSVTEGRAHAWKNDLVMTRIDPFSFKTTSFMKYGGGSVRVPPMGFIRVIPPDPESPALEPGSPAPVLLQRQAVAERHIEQVVVQYLGEIEPGLTLVGRQIPTPAGRLDLLCKDAAGTYVVVEIKRDQGTDRVVGQILRYMGWVKESKGTEVRGIIVVQSRDPALSYAIQATTNVQIKEFRMVFD
jgi:Holliday junction resolvase-like predicted endonuclease